MAVEPLNVEIGVMNNKDECLMMPVSVEEVKRIRSPFPTKAICHKANLCPCYDLGNYILMFL